MTALVPFTIKRANPNMFVFKYIFHKCLLHHCVAVDWWALIANGTKGDNGCIGSDTTKNKSTLPDCKTACKDYEFLQYHQKLLRLKNSCYCFATCDLNRNASDFKYVANVYQNRKGSCI